ncbi:unannotated protein [freshwater metagenome]|uniref:Unannotated protein n=1 Tax=freshwater metagenome TaxID=449393 RepID=A0A6J7BX17_9ZZZZ|nr:16S rRNA (cytidine(1402)-2'-O)-methyltransferase [Actinomycetota bacterium]MSV86561.1 16S rRNA (cytidine(1402)-2'-O)-methyltransferase [Actinomycetota bacterium]MSW67574.1 16S rRNA (cytidine(1402)-2'-O)-methyltransferase [Actinomycetota bacterium]MSX28094.1 16S rRNA (cytidine(1402)-2'-O)-methyltransferase [Actinomycetota bacterium]MSY03307.1 16S rRNA (cytidine(1402)-2'-O)-methyltransferase [Actinomycetota bacterium]
MSLVLAGTPLGNPGDGSLRLRQSIEDADFIAAEDSRKFHRLCLDLNVKFSGKVISFFEGNEEDRTEELLGHLRAGKKVLVVSDAGMPTISDPGFRLMRDAIAQKIEVSVVPGPSAVTTALALSGLPTDRFIFEGFSPRAKGAREKFFESLRFEERSIIWFEAPHRLVESLEDAIKTLGDQRLGAICREMTKTYEEIIRGTLGELLIWAKSKEILGELTIVIAGAEESAHDVSSANIVARVKEYEEAGMDRKTAISTVAQEFDIAKRLVFSAVVEAKSTSKISP